MIRVDIHDIMLISRTDVDCFITSAAIEYSSNWCNSSTTTYSKHESAHEIITWCTDFLTDKLRLSWMNWKNYNYGHSFINWNSEAKLGQQDYRRNIEYQQRNQSIQYSTKCSNVCSMYGKFFQNSIIRSKITTCKDSQCLRTLAIAGKPQFMTAVSRCEQ